MEQEPGVNPEADLETRLRNEIDKWTLRIGEEMKGVKLKSKKKDGERLLKNIKAYIEDSKYFLDKGDHIRSFEAIIWAWSWLEILKEMGVLE